MNKNNNKIVLESASAKKTTTCMVILQFHIKDQQKVKVHTLKTKRNIKKGAAHFQRSCTTKEKINTSAIIIRNTF